MMIRRTEAATSPEVKDALLKLREICAGFEDRQETVSFGNPAFKRGKRTFAVLDRYKGNSCLWILVEPGLREGLIAEGWFPSPYDPHRLALCRHLDTLDWTAAAALIEASYMLARR
jgi:hypothetical protein